MNKQAMIATRKQAQGGFTLIELIVVIVILGILAATALPRFAALGGSARQASVRAAQGALASTVSMVRGQALLNPAAANFVNENVTVAVVNGYPAGTVNTATAAGLNVADYTIVTSVAGTAATATAPAVPVNGFTVVPNSIANTATALTCFVSYAQSVAANVPPVINAAAADGACGQ